MGMGFGVGERRAVSAAEKAANNPLLEDASIQGARKVLVHITSDKSLRLKEINEAVDCIRSKAHPDANVLFGVIHDESLKGEVRITVVAASFEQAEVKAMRKPVFQSQADALSIPRAVNADAFAPVPGVDTPLPGQTASQSAPPSSSGFLRSGLFGGGKATTTETGSPSTSQDYELQQTPAFLRHKKRID